MAENVYDECNEQEGRCEAPQRPLKKFPVFCFHEEEEWFADSVVDGVLGPLPLLVAISRGYDSEARDAFMQPYESQEILFAYKKGAQQRILLQDQNNATYSLPVASHVPFCLSSSGTDTKRRMTISDILQKHQLPLFGVQFARPDRVEFRVDRQQETVDRQQETVDSSHFGPLTLTRVYEEPYLYCLSIVGHSPRPKIAVLPRNLKDVAFAPIAQIKGVTDFTSKLQEFKNKFIKIAQELETHQDPFFRELALVSAGPDPVVGQPEPYIESDTFVAFRTPSSDHTDIAASPQTEPYEELDAIPTHRLAPQNCSK